MHQDHHRHEGAEVRALPDLGLGFLTWVGNVLSATGGGGVFVTAVFSLSLSFNLCGKNPMVPLVFAEPFVS